MAKQKAWYYEEKRETFELAKDLAEHFQTIPNDCLSLIARGVVDATEVAKVELASRGLDNDGKWVGFK